MEQVRKQTQARIVFLWHMHQPSYVHPDGGVPAMPWVRLHATRAYRDLAWIFARHPQAKMVVNFVPCLLDQLEQVVEGATDFFRELTRKAPAELTSEEKRFMGVHFFSCRKETMIDPVPRFIELFERKEQIQAWPAQDLLDLQVHFNLAWMGPAARAADPLLLQLPRQGRNFSAAQKERLMAAQDRVCAEVVPAWRELGERGQVELSTTPYYHPILPLIIDTEAAQRCLPGAPLPPRFAWPDDARLHVTRAIERHAQVFGTPATGMWPAEGSVSPEAVSLLGEHGVRWLATDEGILLRSLRPGMVREHVLYRPYRAPGNGPLMLFRDRDLSDRIGFTYGREPAARAVGDLVGRLRAAGEASIQRGDHPPGGPVILVALDGENPWEGYPDGGVEFLDRLCTSLSEDPLLCTVLPRELDPTEVEELPRLHSGSWIDASYRIWISGPVENRAWTLLGQARRALARAASEGHPRAKEALDVLLPAEGSDWFWWFGDDFTTTQYMLFDGLFRARLRKVYELLQLPVPTELEAPVDERRRLTPGEAQGAGQTATFIQPTIDGRVTGYYEWAGAVEVPLGGGRAAMYQGERRLARLFYGFSIDNLYLRVDLLEDASSSDRPRRLRVLFDGAGGELEIPLAAGPGPEARHGYGLDGVRVATGSIVEVGIPLGSLGRAPGDTLDLHLVLEEDGMAVDRAPGQGPLRVRLPDENLASWSWMI